MEINTADLEDQLPDRAEPLVRLFERASDNHTLTLAAGLAFFGIISVAPAIGVGFALVRLLVSPEAAEGMGELIEGGFTETLGLANLLEQMEDRAGRYVGISLAILVWPATTLASGWTRALDAIAGTESTGGLRGLKGRLRGLVPGGILVAGMFLLLAAAVFGTAMAGGDQVLVLALLAVAAVALQFAFCLTIYRFLPSETPTLGEVWPGAAWAAAGVVVATISFALALTIGEGIAEQYPPALVTAVVIGLWLYLANSALLLGAEWNQIRQDLPGERSDAVDDGTRPDDQE